MFLYIIKNILKNLYENDTLPDSRAAFANFCYNSPTNLVNAKYASIFVNDPEKFKMVSKLARATGTENGGGGGSGGHP